MDFCRINESVPCDEVWHHVDIKVLSHDMVNLTIVNCMEQSIYHTHKEYIVHID